MVALGHWPFKLTEPHWKWKYYLYMWQNFIQAGFHTQNKTYRLSPEMNYCLNYILSCNFSGQAGLWSVAASYLSHWCHHRYYLWHHTMAMALLEWCVVSWYFKDSSNSFLVNLGWFECLERPWMAWTAWLLDSIHLLAPFYTPSLSLPTMPPYRHFLLSAKVNIGCKGTQWYAKRYLLS